MTEDWNPVVLSSPPRCLYLLNPSHEYESDLDKKEALKSEMSCYFGGKCSNKYKFKDCDHIDVNGEKQYGFCIHETDFRP